MNKLFLKKRKKVTGAPKRNLTKKNQTKKMNR